MSEQKLLYYKTVTEVFDWGAAISKVIINWPEEIETEKVDKNTFKVYARRILAEGALSPAEALNKKGVKIDLGSTSKSDNDLQGYREVINAFVSDEIGNKKQKGNFITIEMSVGPNNILSSALHFNLNSFYFNFVKPDYTITQINPINDLKNMIIENNKGDIRPIVDKFKFGHKMIKQLPLPYASYEPSDDKKHPLIIWLHGIAEGGSDNPALPIMGNKACNFADESLQKYFGGAYVLIPQSPTFWMHGKNDFADGTSIYEDTLMGIIKSYISEHTNIDSSRIYIGGDSNGGYMTLLLIRDYPDFFAAAFPTCESLANDLISDDDIKKMAKTPLWFISSKTDFVIPPNKFAIPTVERLHKIGANAHFNLFDDIHDTSGLYKKQDGKPHENFRHCSWIYVYNDECEEIIDGKKVKLMEWLANQKR